MGEPGGQSIYPAGILGHPEISALSGGAILVREFDEDS
jgi:hypothetical protein